MFGIDAVSWGQFTRFIVFILLIWYLSVVFRCWLSRKRRNAGQLFEESLTEPVQAEDTAPVLVGFGDYPAERLALRLADDLALSVSLYEESGLDEGYAIEHFTRAGDPVLPEILSQVHHQQ